MPSTIGSVKGDIEKIIILSQQLLVQLDEYFLAEDDTDTESLTKKLIEQQAKRETLLITFFEQYSTGEIQIHINLVNKLVALDEELTNKSKHLKSNVVEKLLTIKKGRKSAISYQKY